MRNQILRLAVMLPLLLAVQAVMAEEDFPRDVDESIDTEPLEPNLAKDPKPSKSQTSADQDQALKIQKWVAELRSPRFQVREDAAFALVDAGIAAVQPVTDATLGNNLEATSRGIQILKQIALSRDKLGEEAARAALQTLSQGRHRVASRLAGTSLGYLNRLRQERAIAAIKAQGGTVVKRPYNIFAGGQAVIQMTYEVTLGPDFKGTVEDFAELRWMYELTTLTIEGGRFDDTWTAPLAQVQARALEIKRTNISEASLPAIKEIANLERLDLWYSPVSDDAVDILQGFTHVDLLRIYGTEMTMDGAERLKTALDNRGAITSVDHRLGAFLGVGCTEHPLGCGIYTVHPGSAAQKAGILEGDILTSYNGQKVKSFDALTKLIAENVPGDPTTLDIYRQGRTLKLELQLGEWN